MDFADKVVIITGASSGIGAATAIHFSKLSAKLSLVSRKEKNLKTIALYCEKSKGIAPLSIIADVTCEADVERIVSETVNHFGKIDVLINNAGIVAMGGIANMNMEAFDRVISTNLRAVFHLTSVALPHLIDSKGNVVNVSSACGSRPNTMALAYNASKAALDHFTKCVALELAGKGVRVNSVSPNFVKTNLYKNVGLTEDQLELFVKNMVGKTPLKKPVEGSEVASLIEFLASAKAQSITGANYNIDGGSHLV
ncbi:3-oxoacyl-[acyl-carrier-protein] reductase FabG [Eumeta japonica]|uniref:3-oxoacyl-[acyl-carrier-protein] reductase FabG n=1 Tax=Eumeta variegata TaxID=151549 RepID=A0A4C1VVW5_EUMVA|nr:3-oxoacyl-[acyl-carrier-protein] reductase FabG [Eumeta japonica]